MQIVSSVEHKILNKNKKTIISMSSAEFAQRIIKVASVKQKTKL